MATIPPGSTVAVTGASGFIGSHVVEACLKAGYVVRACVRDRGARRDRGHGACGGGDSRLSLIHI